MEEPTGTTEHPAHASVQTNDVPDRVAISRSPQEYDDRPAGGRRNVRLRRGCWIESQRQRNGFLCLRHRPGRSALPEPRVRKRSSPRRPDGPRPPGRPINRRSTAVLSKRENRYLTRQLCWVLTIQGLETYLLTPRDPADIDLLVEAIRPTPSPNDIDVVIGVARPDRPAGDVQWTDGPHRRLRPDLFLRSRGASSRPSRSRRRRRPRSSARRPRNCSTGSCN